MKIRLIQPAQLDDAGRPKKYKMLFLPSATLANLAALTPDDVEVRVTDEYIDPIDFDEEVDLVGLTGLSCHAPRAYQIAGEFKKRGRTVVMGGIHASALPEEALQYVDSVVVGEAEDLWEKVIRDVQKQQPAKIYRSERYPDLKRLVIPRFDLTNYAKCMKALFSKTPAIPIFTTRGCPFNCDFCSVTRFFGGQYRTKPIENVIREIEASGARDFFFVDDNIMANHGYAEQLFKAIMPLKIRWFSQFSTLVLKTPQLVELAGASGCHEVILGVETINEENLKSVHKEFNKIENYSQVLKLLKDNGISPNVMIIYGMDNDDISIFQRTMDFLLNNDVNFIHLNILTPFPGTELYKRLLKEERIFERDWSRYDVDHAVFYPGKVSPAELTDNVWKGYGIFYAYSNIFKRFWKFRKVYLNAHWKNSFFDDLMFQLYYHSAVKKKIDPYTGGIC